MLKLRGRRGLRWQALPLVLAIFRLVGGRWTDFYSWMLNRQERRNTIDDIIERTPRYSGRERGLYDLSVAPFHIDLLRKAGLTPNSTVLDFGCGFGRSAAHLVPYLAPGHYVGVDLSAERIRMAQEYMHRLDLTEKRPEFLLARKDNDLSFLGSKRFDLVWARAVFAHMPFEDMGVCLKQIHKILKEDGVLVGDYCIGEEFHKKSIKAFYYTEPATRKLVEESGYIYNVIDDWEIGIAPEHRHAKDTYRMLCISKRAQHH